MPSRLPKGLLEKINQQGLITINDAARILGVSKDTVRRWDGSGKIKSVRTGGGHRRFNLDEIEKVKIGAAKPLPAEKLTITDAARALGVSKDTIRRWEKGGKIESIKTKGGHRRFDLKELEIVKLGRLKPGITQKPQVIISPSTISLSKAKSRYSFIYLVGLIILLTLFQVSIGWWKTIKLKDYEKIIRQPEKITEKRLELPPAELKEEDLLQVLADQGGKYEGDVVIEGDLEVTETTTTYDLVVYERAIFGSSLVVAGNEIINSKGKIPALNGSYFADLNGENLTNVNALHLGGQAASAFLRSNENDTAEAVITFTASPGSTDVSGGPLYINPAASSYNYTLMGIAVGGNSKFKVDAEGDVTASGGLRAEGNLDINGLSNDIAGNLNLSDVNVSNDLTVNGTIYGNVSGTITPNFTAGSVVFANASGNLAQDNANFFWDDSANRLGIGTTTPAVPLEIVGTTGNPYVLNIKNEGWHTHTTFNFYNANDTDTYRNIFQAFRARGTLASPSDVLVNDLVFSITGMAYIDGVYRTNSSIDLGVGSTPGVGSYPSFIKFSTTGNNETSRSERMRINESGYIGIGTTSPGTKLSVAGGVGIGTTDSFANAAIAANNLAVQGSVGIGTTSPDVPLHLLSPLASGEIVKFEGTSHALIFIESPTAGAERSINFTTDQTAGLKWKIGMDNTPAGNSNDFSIKQTNNAAAEFIINTSGLVGIGTTSPGAKLQINTGGDAVIGQIVRANSASQTANLTEWQNSGGGVLANITSDGKLTTKYVQALDNTGLYLVADDGTNGLFVRDSGDAEFSVNALYWRFKNAALVSGRAIGVDADDHFIIGDIDDVFSNVYLRAGGGNKITISDAGNVLVSGFTASTIGLTVKAAASQSANLTEWQNSGGTPLLLVDANGHLTGGTATTSDLYLKTTTGVGTTGADMHFLVGSNGGTEAMTILNSGNVGIGTTSPQEKLQVEGNLRLQDNFKIYGDVSEIIREDSLGLQVSQNNLRLGAGSNTYPLLSRANTTELAISTNNSESVRINSSGYVGIGTTSPGAKLSVAGGVGIGTTDSFANAAIAANNLAVQGRVGIGTTNPTANLEILGTNSGTTPALKASTGYIDLPVGFQQNNSLIANNLIMHLPFNFTVDTSRGIAGTYTRTDTTSGSTSTYLSDNNLITYSAADSFPRTQKSYISRGILIEDTRRNMLLNPGFETTGTPPSGWTNNNLSTATTTTTYRKQTSYSAQLVAGGSAGQLYRTPTAALTNTSNYPLTAYVYNGTSGNIGGTVDGTVASLYSSGTISATTYTNIGGGWWLMRATLTGQGTSPNIGIQVEANKTVYVDAIQIDATVANAGVNFPTSFINNTTAVRARGVEILTYPAYANYGKQHLTQDTGSLSFWFEPIFASSELTASDKLYFVEAGTVACQDSAAGNCLVKIYLNGPDQKFYAAIYNGIDYTTASVSSAPLSFNANAPQFVSFRWNSSTGNITLNVNGVETSNTVSPWTPPTLDISHIISIGAPALSSATTNRANALISDFASFNRSLSADEVAQIYNSKAPIQDFERSDLVMLSQGTSYQQTGNIRISGALQTGGAVTAGSTISGTNISGSRNFYGTYTGFAPTSGLIQDLAVLYPFNFTLTNSKGDGSTFTRADAVSDAASYQREPDLELGTVSANYPRFERGTIPAAYTSKGPGNPGLWMEASRKNVALYSSFEAGDPPTGWTIEAGSPALTASSDSTFQIHGNKSVKLVNSTTIRRYYQQINFTGATVQHQISAYAYLGNASQVGNAVAAANVGLYASTNLTDAALSTTYTSVGKGWYRMTAAFTPTAAVWNVGFRVPASQIVYVDAIQIERTPGTPDTATFYPTTYIPTTTTSEITRAAETLTYPAPSALQPDRGSVSFWFKPQWARNITSDNADKYIFEITNYLRLYLSGSGDTMNLDAWGGSSWTNIMTTGTNTINRYGWNFLSFSWNANGSMAGYLNTTALTATTTTWTLQNPVGQTIYIGSDATGSNQADALISELAFYNRILDVYEMLQLYYNNSQLTDFYTTISPVLQASSGLQLTQSGDLNISGKFLSGLGSVSSPAFSFGSDTNTGIFSPEADTLALTTNATEHVRLNSSGLIGIGITAPGTKLSVAGGVGIGTTDSFANAAIAANNLAVQGNVGIGVTNPTTPLYVKAASGDIATFQSDNSTGCTLSSGGIIACSSDITLKKNIDNLENSLDKVMVLNPVLFNWNNQTEGSPKQAGFIAQETETIFPDLVKTDSDGLKSVSMIGMIPYLVKGTQELNSRIEEVEKKFINSNKLLSNDNSNNELALMTDVLTKTEEGEVKLKVNEIDVRDINVLGDAILGDVTIAGELQVGSLMVDGISKAIDAVGTLQIQPMVLGKIELMGNTIEIDQSGNIKIKEGVIAGNSNFRDTVIIPAGKTTVRIEKNWDSPPVSLTATADYNTNVWVTDRDETGFTLNVGSTPLSEARVDWVAIW